MSKVAGPLLKQKIPTKATDCTNARCEMFNIGPVKLKKLLNFVRGFPIRRPKPMFTK